MTERGSSTRDVRLWQLDSGRAEPRGDRVAAEEPLEIKLEWQEGGSAREATAAVTMRTPGDDPALALGFLFSEGIVARPDQVLSVRPGGLSGNEITVALAAGVAPRLAGLERHFFTNSACGVCGRVGIENLVERIVEPTEASNAVPRVTAATLAALPARLRAAQGIFEATGGLHAAALFERDGTFLDLAEDVGRHNALDKLIGRRFRAGELPLGDQLVLVSGRASYEILQKCLVAGVRVICAVSAPSSLAVELASRFGATLVGFLRGERANIYTGSQRIGLEPPPPAGLRVI